MRKAELGGEYLNMAGIIKRKMDFLQGELKNPGERTDLEERDRLRRRLNLLFSMYMDCSITGKYLIKRDRLEEQRRGLH